MGTQRTWLAALMAVGGIVALSWARLRWWMFTWGADDDEVTGTLPGDELVMDSAPRTTRAISIDAPAASVWPWLAQIGEDQNPRVGDDVWLARRHGDRARQVVAKVKPRSHLVLMSPEDFQRVRRGEMASGSWGFHLHRQNGSTRLIVRGSGGLIGHTWFDIPHFVMEQRTMRGIRRRAERARRDSALYFLNRESVGVQARRATITGVRAD